MTFALLRLLCTLRELLRSVQNEWPVNEFDCESFELVLKLVVRIYGCTLHTVAAILCGAHYQRHY